MPSLRALAQRIEARRPPMPKARSSRPGFGRKPRSHLIIPDTQVKPGVPIDHFDWIGRYIVERRPDVIVHLGDHFDLPSLSTHADPESMEKECARLSDDIDAGTEAIDRMNRWIDRVRGYDPDKYAITGNHDGRWDRYIEARKELEGALVRPMDVWASRGWEVVPFLKPITIDGVTYCHFFPRGPAGQVTQGRNGAPSAKAQVQREMRTCVAGHKQGLDIHVQAAGDRQRWGIIAGSCYLHQEDYLTPQGNRQWHGVIVLHEVYDGDFDPMLVSLEYLCRRYGRGRWPR